LASIGGPTGDAFCNGKTGTFADWLMVKRSREPSCRALGISGRIAIVSVPDGPHSSFSGTPGFVPSITMVKSPTGARRTPFCSTVTP